MRRLKIIVLVAAILMALMLPIEAGLGLAIAEARDTEAVLGGP